MHRINRPSRSPSTVVAFVALFVGVVGTATAASAPSAARNDDDEPSKCISETEATKFRAADREVKLGKSTNLTWEVRTPGGCGGLRLYIGPTRLSSRSGTKTYRPVANTGYSLIARERAAQKTLARTSVKVDLGNRVTIHGNHMVPTLRQALQTENQEIRVRNGVDLNVESWGDPGVYVASGVKLIGTRSPTQLGPRIYTTKRPKRLLRLNGDRIRISGMRIEGGEKGVYDGDGSDGIEIESNRDIEIDNNELFGWTGSAIEVRDNSNRIEFTAPYTIRIHDNYIHHNRHYGRLGYGIAAVDGSFVLIDRNVFDYNRHAIAGDGSDWSGYSAVDNLVLENGGEHKHFPVYGWDYTHQFDMHGQSNCGVGDIFSDSVYNCGRAGHHVNVQYNAFRYTRNPAFKLRGTPQLAPAGAQVSFNVFRHGSAGEALQQTESGMREEFNQFGVDPLGSIIKCDYDGDGRQDAFGATGQTWWYASGGVRHWVFVKRSTERPAACPPRPRPARRPARKN